MEESSSDLRKMESRRFVGIGGLVMGEMDVVRLERREMIIKSAAKSSGCRIIEL